MTIWMFSFVKFLFVSFGSAFCLLLSSSPHLPEASPVLDVHRSYRLQLQSPPFLSWSGVL